MKNKQIQSILRSSIAAAALTLTCASLPAIAAKPAATEAEKLAAAQVEIERAFLVGLFALKELCTEQYPKSAKQIQAGHNENFTDAPDELINFAKTKPFVARVAARKKEQVNLIKDPAEKSKFRECAQNWLKRN